METGDREVKAVELALIARALEVSVDDLVGAGEQSPEARLAALARSVVHNIDQARDLLEDALSELAQASILVREHPEIAPSTTSYLDSVASSFEREDPPYVVLTTREDRDAMRRLLTTLVNSFTLVVAPPQDQDHGERREAP